jgi:hypothetical protein
MAMTRWMSASVGPNVACVKKRIASVLETVWVWLLLTD